MLSNPVVISIVVLLALSLLRVNVVIALVISALTAGLCGDLGLSKTIEAFTGGLGGGASGDELCDARCICHCDFKIWHH